MGIKWLDKSRRSPVSCKEISRKQVANRLQSRCKQGFIQPLYAHIKIEDYNRRLVGDRFATRLRLLGDWSPYTQRHVCNQVKPIGDQSATSRRSVGDWHSEALDANG